MTLDLESFVELDVFADDLADPRVRELARELLGPSPLEAEDELGPEVPELGE